MNALQVFEPEAHTVYTIELAAQLAQVPRRLIVSITNMVWCLRLKIQPAAVGILMMRRSASCAGSNICGPRAA